MLKHGKYILQHYIIVVSKSSFFFSFSFSSSSASTSSTSTSSSFSSLSGRAGVPMEVMGLMLGEFVDDYTVRVIDVFAMPQSGTVRLQIHPLSLHTYLSSYLIPSLSLSFPPSLHPSPLSLSFPPPSLYPSLHITHSTYFIIQGVSVEAVDPVFQAKMLDMLKQTGR